MRVAVVGAGGVGGYFGGKLAAAGVDTTFLVRGRTLEAIRERGLLVESVSGDFALPQARATDDPGEIGPVDAVLLTVKAWQVEEVLPSLRPLLHESTVVVPLENGIEAAEQVSRVLGARHAVGGLCVIISFIVGPGHVRQSSGGGEPAVTFGELDDRRSERLEQLRDAFTKAGVKADIPADIQRAIWQKFVFIAPLSAIGAVTRAPTGDWREVAQTRALAVQAIHEVVAVARAKGIALPGDSVEKTLGRYDGLPHGSTSSMQRDVMDGRPSELEAQVGAVVRLGTEHGIATPAFDFLYAALLPQERIARR
ncbi:MAG: 2-dehydropantoate 2-reductase [Thermoanaerobaculia bacterium]